MDKTYVLNDKTELTKGFTVFYTCIITDNRGNYDREVFAVSVVRRVADARKKRDFQNFKRT